jgi:hypothetical protein
MVLEHPNSGELELFIMPRQCLGNAKRVFFLPSNDLALACTERGGRRASNNKQLEQQSGFGALACRHAVTRTAEQ